MEYIKAAPLAVSFAASDGFELKGQVWQHAAANAGATAAAAADSRADARPVVIINPATSVRASYYARFAAFLHRHGFDVLTYDYRGIGESRPATLKGFEAGWIDWGRLDFESALQFAAARFPGQPIQVVAHSVGGFLIGLAASNHRVSRVFTVGAQFAYWRDYAPDKRLQLFLKWHIFMPAVTSIVGYFPGNRLGWLEDTPRGVVRDWTARHPRFEDNWRTGRRILPEHEREELLVRFAAMHGDTLALSLSDDEFGTVAAIRRLLGYFRNADRTHLHLAPAAIQQKSIGHFAFFHSRFEPTLWQIPLEWLQHGRLPPQPKGDVVHFAAGS